MDIIQFSTFNYRIQQIRKFNRDDHPQYLKADGSRQLSNNWNTNKDISALQLLAQTRVGTPEIKNTFDKTAGVAVEGCLLRNGLYNNVNIEDLNSDVAQILVDLSNVETDLNGFPQQLKNLTATEIQQLQNINSTTVGSTAWSHVGTMNQSVSTTSSPSFNTTTTQFLDGPDNSHWTSTNATSGGTARIYHGHDISNRMHKYPTVIAHPCIVAGTCYRNENFHKLYQLTQ